MHNRSRYEYGTQNTRMQFCAIASKRLEKSVLCYVDKWCRQRFHLDVCWHDVTMTAFGRTTAWEHVNMYTSRLSLKRKMTTPLILHLHFFFFFPSEFNEHVHIMSTNSVYVDRHWRPTRWHWPKVLELVQEGLSQRLAPGATRYVTVTSPYSVSETSELAHFPETAQWISGVGCDGRGCNTDSGSCPFSLHFLFSALIGWDHLLEPLKDFWHVWILTQVCEHSAQV